MFTVVCWPKRTIFVPARQSQHTSALSAPAETRFFEDNATEYQACQIMGKVQKKDLTSPNAIQMSRQLLQRTKCDRREQVNTAVVN